MEAASDSRDVMEEAPEVTNSDEVSKESPPEDN